MASPLSLKNLRIAIVGTPRSGNTWLSLLIHHIYHIPEIALPTLPENFWEDLPNACVIQIHQLRNEEIENKLTRYGFQVITPVRHPLDVLISILHYAIWDGQTHHWLDGLNGDEKSIYGAMPRSRVFLDYCESSRVQSLLSISKEWIADSRTKVVRYEELVGNPTKILEPLIEQINPLGLPEIATALKQTELNQLKPKAANHHFWLGKPGLWQQLFTPCEIELLRSAILPIATAEEYSLDFTLCSPPTALEADQNWIKYFGLECRNALAELVRRRLERKTIDQKPFENREDMEKEIHRLNVHFLLLNQEAERLGHLVNLMERELIHYKKIPQRFLWVTIFWHWLQKKWRNIFSSKKQV